MRSGIIVLLFLAAVLAGCVSGEEPQPAGEGEGERVTEETGAIVGRVLTEDLDEVKGARIALVLDGELVAESQSTDNGQYTLGNLEPGQYRLQFNAPCCREHVQGVEVTAGEETRLDVQLVRFTQADLQTPYREERDWTGFISCSLRAGVGLALCSLVDPNEDFLHEWEIKEGAETVVGAMQWGSPGAGLGSEMVLTYEVAGAHNENPNYARTDGPSPQEFRVDAGNRGDNNDYQNIEGTQGQQFRIFAGGTLNVVYQLEFTVYWHIYYYEAAPEGATAVPDL